jgi:predicted DCC family thiol-disulfide oxidoreductase YuxK
MSQQREDAAVAVLYNADCPICRFEVDHHKKKAAEQGLDVAFEDLNTDARQDWGVDEDTAARRLHVRTAQGVVTGWEANLAMWRAMPRWRWVARLASLPGVTHLLGFLYERVFAPLVYRLHLRRKAR